MATSLLSHYRTATVKHLQKELGIANVMAMPKLQKIVITVGIGSWIARHGKDYSEITKNITRITGQKPRVDLSRKAVSNFKLRAGQPVGLTITLRGSRMYAFLDRLINVNLPRVRDFRGVGRRFDPRGNYSLGIADYSMFSELPADAITKTTGLSVTMVFSNSDPAKSRALLEDFGMPFRK